MTLQEAYELYERENEWNPTARDLKVQRLELKYEALREDIHQYEVSERDAAWNEIQELGSEIAKLDKMTDEEYLQKRRWGA